VLAALLLAIAWLGLFGGPLPWHDPAYDVIAVQHNVSDENGYPVRHARRPRAGPGPLAVGLGGAGPGVQLADGAAGRPDRPDHGAGRDRDRYVDATPNGE
jgi:hypothetical protein